MTEITADKGWFKQNPSTNFRVRDAHPGEVAELAETLLPVGRKWDGSFNSPPGATWRILAIRLPLGKVARMLTLAMPATPPDEFALMPVALGSRLAVG